MAWCMRGAFEQPLVFLVIATVMLAGGGDGEAAHDGCSHETKLMDKVLAEQKQLIQEHNAEKARLREALHRSDERFAKLQMELVSIRKDRTGTSSTGGLEPHAWSRLTAPQGPLGKTSKQQALRDNKERPNMALLNSDALQPEESPRFDVGASEDDEETEVRQAQGSLGESASGRRRLAGGRSRMAKASGCPSMEPPRM